MIVALYLAIGLLFTAAVFFLAREERRPLGGGQFLRRRGGGEDLIAAAVVAGLGVSLWPIAVVVGAYLFVDARINRPGTRDVEALFKVRRKHLGVQLSRGEIEAAERITDPLGGVPDAPFGHLNPAWQRFLNQLPEGGRIARFSAQWRTRLGSEFWEGYAILNKGHIGPHWVSSKRELVERT